MSCSRRGLPAISHNASFDPLVVLKVDESLVGISTFAGVYFQNCERPAAEVEISELCISLLGKIRDEIFPGEIGTLFFADDGSVSSEGIIEGGDGDESFDLALVENACLVEVLVQGVKVENGLILE